MLFIKATPLLPRTPVRDPSFLYVSPPALYAPRNHGMQENLPILPCFDRFARTLRRTQYLDPGARAATLTLFRHSHKH